MEESTRSNSGLLFHFMLAGGAGPTEISLKMPLFFILIYVLIYTCLCTYSCYVVTSHLVSETKLKAPKCLWETKHSKRIMAISIC